MQHNLTFVQLTAEQIAFAKEANGSRKQITHGLICGPHGQIFGTEKQCQKYYSVWADTFPNLFDKGIKTNNFKINNYKETFNLVNILIEIHDSLENESSPKIKTLPIKNDKQPANNLVSRLWTRITGS
ncbi:hypothetical protein [Pseudomonas sp. NFACC08-1]|uniref:hypothetical protein n=1 Tax=Pseudomonas sp. NFACC08-1 TaxID=1566238 RepID=UPI000896FBDA|nr:hypothetical protein [Pseudomonas sp. NFACC08-1]SDX78091.1 hypothetical protein SAMN03159474_03794 [Pseudomonas sp. NFACC08-1]